MQTVQCIVVSFEIVTIQAVKFVYVVNCLREQFCFQDICYFLIDQYKDKYALQHYDCFESNINIMMVRNNHN